MSTDTQQSWAPACQLVNEDNGPRFMDSYIWASISEEVDLAVPALASHGAY